MRVPNLFSAPPDVLLGAALTTAAGGTVSAPMLAVLVFASVCLYAGGVVLNDYFDASRDAVERPERPIPSGRVSRRTAGVSGAVLLVVGVGLAFVAGPSSAAIATALALAVVLYDAVLKGTVGGFLAMGSARTFNVLLGVTAANTVGDVLDAPLAVAVSVVVGSYIALVTFMAANEATDTSRRAVVAGAAGVVLAAIAVLSTTMVVGPGFTEGALAIVLLVGFLVWTGRALRAAYVDPRPETVGPAVGVCVLGLVVLDAAFAAVVGVGWSLSILVFLVPALWLSRAFDVS